MHMCKCLHEYLYATSAVICLNITITQFMKNCMCVNMCIYIYIYIYIYVYICIYMNKYMYTRIYIYIYMPLATNPKHSVFKT